MHSSCNFSPEPSQFLLSVQSLSTSFMLVNPIFLARTRTAVIVFPHNTGWQTQRSSVQLHEVAERWL
jgi:hypothetical protein